MLCGQIDCDDWGISDQVLLFDGLSGPPSVDRLATYYDKKVAQFNSKSHILGCKAVDVFTVIWEGEKKNGWLPQCPWSQEFWGIWQALGLLALWSAPAGSLCLIGQCSSQIGYNPTRAVSEIYERLSNLLTLIQLHSSLHSATVDGPLKQRSVQYYRSWHPNILKWWRIPKQNLLWSNINSGAFMNWSDWAVWFTKETIKADLFMFISNA